MTATAVDNQQQAKIAAGRAVSELVADGMILGVGTGSTAAEAIRAIGRRVREENLSVRGVPTSFVSEQLARANGITVVSLDEVDSIDLAFDGADEVDPRLNLIKGRGGAQSREKVVANAARQFYVLVDESKIVQQLGTNFPVPIEFVPMALGPLKRLIVALGGRPELRMGKAKDGPVVSDQGLWILDAYFDGIEDAYELNRSLSDEPGILDHGLFLDLATHVLVGQASGAVREIVRDSPN